MGSHNLQTLLTHTTQNMETIQATMFVQGYYGDLFNLQTTQDKTRNNPILIYKEDGLVELSSSFASLYLNTRQTQERTIEGVKIKAAAANEVLVKMGLLQGMYNPIALIAFFQHIQEDERRFITIQDFERFEQAYTGICVEDYLKDCHKSVDGIEVIPDTHLETINGKNVECFMFFFNSAFYKSFFFTTNV